MQYRGTCCLKKCLIRKDQREFLCAKIWRNSIVNENVIHFEHSLKHYKGHPSNYLFQLFPHCKGDQKKTVAISQMFNHVQLHVHWMHLLNTRICRYTCIYITPTCTLQTLHYCPAGAWRWNDIVLTSMWHYHIASTSFWLHVPAGCDQDKCVKVVRPWKWDLPCSVGVFLTKFGHKLLLSLSAKPDYMWKNWKK